MGTEPLSRHINLMVKYTAIIWHANAVLAPQSPHESTVALFNTPQLILHLQLFFSSKLPVETHYLDISRGVKKNFTLYMP